MKITIPDSIRALEPALAEFFDGMVFKLHVNSHKAGLTENDIPKFIDMMLDELTEFKEQYAADPSAMNVLSETWDGANFWFLMFAFLRQQGVATERERFIEEYYDIQPDLGQVFCVKKRSGSKYGPGDEVLGTKNKKGEVMIRAQSAAGGFGITLLRSHMIWWKTFGVWPEPGQEVTHSDGDASNDEIGNLVLIGYDDGKEGKLPFVTQWCPAGKENNPNWGKWVYQRRHMFQLIRCGYYETALEAATEGLKAWKAKTLEKQGDKANV